MSKRKDGTVGGRYAKGALPCPICHKRPVYEQGEEFYMGHRLDCDGHETHSLMVWGDTEELVVRRWNLLVAAKGKP